ncbi:MAG TPA: hypothetical protein VJL87_01360 [Bdellovibrionota bacterium]|nr:hypothetical protein [Bdellovibrionota bacterium]
MNKKVRNKIECQHCGNRVLEKEPACVSCPLCGWVNYLSVPIEAEILQEIINRQYRTSCLRVQVNGIYKVNQQIIRDGKEPLSMEDQQIFNSTPVLNPENGLIAKRWLKRKIRKEISPGSNGRNWD